MINWHRLFGLVLSDYFTGTPYDVELEKDLSRKRQLLDVVIIKKGEKEGKEIDHICDGLENLKNHNLLTFKSINESLMPWAIEELIGHYVNYRKIIGVDNNEPDDIGLYAVTTRFPSVLKKEVGLEKVKDGVFTLKAVSRTVTVIVTSDVSDDLRNALWNLFSMREKKAISGIKNYKWKTSDFSTIYRCVVSKIYKEGDEDAVYI